MGVSESESEGVSGLAMARSEAAPGPSFDEARSFAGFGEIRTVDRGLAECGTPRVERDQIPHAATSAAAAADVSLLSLLFCRCRDALAAQSISTSFSTKHQIHLASVSKTTSVAPRRCPSTAGSPNHNSTSPPPPLPLLEATCRRVSLHAQVHRIMRLNLRSVRPNAVFSSFLGLLDIKLGECGSSYSLEAKSRIQGDTRGACNRGAVLTGLGAEIILLFGVRVVSHIVASRFDVLRQLRKNHPTLLLTLASSSTRSRGCMGS